MDRTKAVLDSYDLGAMVDTLNGICASGHIWVPGLQEIRFALSEIHEAHRLDRLSSEEVKLKVSSICGDLYFGGTPKTKIVERLMDDLDLTMHEAGRALRQWLYVSGVERPPDGYAWDPDLMVLYAVDENMLDAEA